MQPSVTKKLKIDNGLSSLPWKAAEATDLVGGYSVGESNEASGGVMMFEEIDAGTYEIVDGRLSIKPREKESLVSDKLPLKKKHQQKKVKEVDEVLQQVAPEIENDMSEWDEFGLDTRLVAGLSKMGYTSPTPIQRMCFPRALRDGCDILGAAETGSGKTLSFGLPVLNGLLQNPSTTRDSLDALVLTPTRELAVQVGKHLKDVIDASNQTQLSVGVIVGGMAVPKQERIIRQKPSVIVATPGRFWALVKSGHFKGIESTLRFLVVDEADRMFDQGHFPDLKPFISLLVQAKEKGEPPKHKRQTFLFSATLLLINPPMERKKPNKKNKKVKKSEETDDAPLVALMKKIGLRGKPAMCVVESEHKEKVELAAPQDKQKKERTINLPENLTFSELRCLEKDKDLYLYYFLTHYKGRCLVFVNTIAALRRLGNVLNVLQVENVTTLHANMQQKQRLKHLERFTRDACGVLVASDVAARGLDISGIDYVVHYGIPKKTDAFVHRSGRTARANAAGFCLSLVVPTEVADFNRIADAIGPERISEFPVVLGVMAQLKERLVLAKRIQLLESKKKGRDRDRNWMVLNAKACDMIIDDDDDEKDRAEGLGGSEKEVISLRKRLSMLLQVRIIAKGTPLNYITNSEVGRSHPEALIDNSRDALKDAAVQPQRRRKK